MSGHLMDQSNKKPLNYVLVLLVAHLSPLTIFVTLFEKRYLLDKKLAIDENFCELGSKNYRNLKLSFINFASKKWQDDNFVEQPNLLFNNLF
jgi:hypothetical protein